MTTVFVLLIVIIIIVALIIFGFVAVVRALFGGLISLINAFRRN